MTDDSVIDSELDDILSIDDTEPVDIGEGEEVSEEYLLSVLEHMGEEDEHDPADVLEGVEVEETRGFGASAPSINGFPCGNSPSALGVRVFTVPGTAVKVPVKAEVAPLLIGFLREWNQRVEPLRAGWCWGYAARSVRGSTAPSFHWAGIAVDGNAPKHPLGVRGTFTPSQRVIIRALAKKYGLRWGGDYINRADEMHGEVILNRTNALALVRRLQAQPAPRPPAPKPSGDTPVPPTIQQGARGPVVKRLQALLMAAGHNLSAEGGMDGDFGPGLKRELAAFQRARGLGADGICGPNTWRRLILG